MPEQRLIFTPGVDIMRTPTTMKGGWVDGSGIRWKEGFPEKMAGFKRICDTAVAGRGRTLHFWTDLADKNWLAIGTNSQLYVEQNANLYNLTPAAWPGGFADATPGQQYSPMIWSLDNFGQDLIAIPNGGAVYKWTPILPTGLATAIAQAPAVNNGGFVAMPQRIIMAYGCTPVGGGAADPLLVRWCDQSDYTDWVASTTNVAGSFRLSRGSRVVGGISCALGQFLWTDLDLWAVQFQGFPLVFGFNNIGANTGLLSQNGIVAVGSSIYWVSDHGFYTLSGGGVQTIPCTVWDKFFKNLNLAQGDKVVAGTDQNQSNEVWWFYPSLNGGSGEIDSYVKYNFLENLWDFGAATPEQANQMARTAWTDQNRPGSPLSIDLNGLIQQQDQGVDADGQPLRAFIQSGYSDLSDGRDIIFLNRLIPDFLWNFSTTPTPSLELTLLGRNWPGDQPTVIGPFTITPTTQYITCRARFRETAVKISSDGLGVWWRMGTQRLRGQADGRI